MEIDKFDTIGDYLRFLRKKEGFSQKKLGKNIGTIGTHISKWENNRNKITRHYALKLANVFNVPVINFEDFKTAKENSSTGEIDRYNASNITPESAAKEARRRLESGQFSDAAEEHLLEVVLKTLQDIELTLHQLMNRKNGG